MKQFPAKHTAPHHAHGLGRNMLPASVLLVALFILASAFPARGNDWACLAWDKSDNCSAYYNEKMKRTGHRVDVRTRRIMTEALLAMDKDVSDQISHVEYVESYNCQNGTFRILSLTTFRKDETSLPIDLQKSQWTEISPGSTQETVFKLACGKEKRKAVKKTEKKAKKKTKKKTR